MELTEFAENGDVEKLTQTEDNKNDNITFDDVLNHVGEFGTFQKILYLMFSIPYVETAMQLLGWGEFVCIK